MSDQSGRLRGRVFSLSNICLCFSVIGFRSNSGGGARPGGGGGGGGPMKYENIKIRHQCNPHSIQNAPIPGGGGGGGGGDGFVESFLEASAFGGIGFSADFMGSCFGSGTGSGFGGIGFSSGFTIVVFSDAVFD